MFENKTGMWHVINKVLKVLKYYILVNSAHCNIRVLKELKYYILVHSAHWPENTEEDIWLLESQGTSTGNTGEEMVNGIA